MKKKITLAILILAVLCLLSGCMAIPGSTLESMFGNTQNTQNTASTQTSAPNSNPGTASTGDTVTISREEYEKLSMFSNLAMIYDAIDQAFLWETDKDKLIDYAAKGMMVGLDDGYSFYYDPEEFEAMWEDDEGKYGVFKGTPAEKAGVHRGDILYRVGEDLYVTAENLTEAVNQMRGTPGEDVSVTFLRNGEEITFTMTREEIIVNRVESKMLEPEIGYIALYEFAGEADKEFTTALNQQIADGAKGIIIDLRDNGGGWVDQAQAIGDLFMDEGEVCYLIFKDGSTEHYYPTKNGKVDVKLVLLVNEMSASTSEILTGALRDCADATVVGTNTFGKGIVQNVYYVGDKGAGFQLTVAEYMTPKGNKVHGVGIAPDVVIERPEGDPGIYSFADIENDIQLAKALEVMKEKLQAPAD